MTRQERCRLKVGKTMAGNKQGKKGIVKAGKREILTVDGRQDRFGSVDKIRKE